MEIKQHALSPQRSRTDPQTVEAKAEPSHLPRRLRATTLRNKIHHDPPQHHHQHRRHAKDVVQSALETRPPISFDSLLRRDRRSPSPRKRHHLTSGQQESQQQRQLKEEQHVTKPITLEDVAKARKENERREEELRWSLRQVEDVGMSSTRQLDDTYYSILEKLSLLRSTVQSLQQLADEGRKMRSRFDADAEALERETNDNLTSFGDFEQQEQTINDLVQRLQTSREKTDRLNERLEGARHRVEAFERRENEKESSRRTRWRFIWGTLAVVVMLMVAILIARNRRAVGHQLNHVGHRLAKLGDAVEEVAEPGWRLLRPAPSEDPWLKRLFDEL